MRRRSALHSICFVVSIVVAGCQGGRATSLQQGLKPGTAPATSTPARGGHYNPDLPQEIQDQINANLADAESLDPLVIAEPAASDLERVAAWQVADFRACSPQIWGSSLGLKAGYRDYLFSHDGSEPGQLEDLAAYTFAWPVIVPGCASLIPLRPLNGLREVIQENGSQVFDIGTVQASQMIATDFQEGTLAIHHPFAEKDGNRFVYLGDTLDADSFRLSPPPYPERTSVASAILPTESPEWRWTRLQQAERWAAAEDLRLVFAARTVQALIDRSARNLWHLPTSLPEIERYSGHKLINAVENGSTAPRLRLEFDGAQAYRFTLEFSGGVSHEYIYYVHKLDSVLTTSIIPAERLTASGHSGAFSPLGALNLVSPATASLPQ